MSQLVDIRNRQDLLQLLSYLKSDSIPLWGKMKPQQMVEHLVNEIQHTNGKKISTCGSSAEEAYQSKQKWIYTDATIPKNVVFVTLPEKYTYASLEAAIDQMMLELEDFYSYFQDPTITAIHGGFGPMNYNEWLIWHGKHFTHHFKQFGLISEVV